MNNPQYTPKQAIELINKELAALCQEEWDSDTLPNLVEWLGMITDHTDLKKGDLSDEVRGLLNRCTHLSEHTSDELSEIGCDAQHILDCENKNKPTA